MSVRVVDSEKSKMIYNIEILREDQMTPRDTMEVLGVPKVTKNTNCTAYTIYAFVFPSNISKTLDWMIPCQVCILLLLVLL